MKEMSKSSENDINHYCSALIKCCNEPIPAKYIRFFSRQLARLTKPDRPRLGEITSLISLEDNLPYAFLERVSRWIPANPSKAATYRQITSTYLPIERTEHAQHDCANARLAQWPSRFGLDAAIENKKNRVILLKGPRGIGKTAFLNYWLTIRTRELESKDITWFRIDIAKIYEIWVEHRYSIEQLPSLIIRYHRVHTLYVLLVYSGHMSTREDQHRFPHDETSDLFRRVLRSMQSDRKLYDHIEHFARDLRKIADSLIPQLGERYDISREVVAAVLARADKRMLDCIGDIIDGFNSECKRLRIEALLIVDGLDNISWSHAPGFYVASCEAIAKFVGIYCKELNARAILAVRPETAWELEVIATRSDSGWNNLSAVQGVEGSNHVIKHLSVRVPNPIDIVRTKVAASLGDVFRHEFDNALRQLPETAYRETCLQRLGHAHVTVEKTIRDLIGVVNLELNQLAGWRAEYKNQESRIKRPIEETARACCELLFDNDVRAFLENVLRIIRVQYFAMSRRVPRADEPDRLVQHIFLNGKTFLDSADMARWGARKDCRERGSVFPNIFWYDTALNKPEAWRWHGLAGLRLLQALRMYGPQTAGDLVSMLFIVFEYDRGVVREIIEAFIAFGLVEVQVFENRDMRHWHEKTGHKLIATVDNSVTSNLTAVVEITAKGHLYFEYVWGRPELLYFFALDTPLGNGFVNDDSRYVRNHRSYEDYTSIVDFYRAAIPTGQVLLRHIVHFSRVEKDRALREIESIREHLKPLIQPDDLQEYINCLDDFGTWVERFSAFVELGLNRKHGDDEIVQVEELKLDLEGFLREKCRQMATQQ